MFVSIKVDNIRLWIVKNNHVVHWIEHENHPHDLIFNTVSPYFFMVGIFTVFDW